ncbi:MAG: hypothetical protein U0R72_11525 [Nakamurella multipartita]
MVVTIGFGGWSGLGGRGQGDVEAEGFELPDVVSGSASDSMRWSLKSTPRSWKVVRVGEQVPVMTRMDRAIATIVELPRRLIRRR